MVFMDDNSIVLIFKIEWLNEGWGIETWSVVENDPDPSNNVISKMSPLGAALTNGDETFLSPEGRKHYRILEVKDGFGNTIKIHDLKKNAQPLQKYSPSTPVDIRIGKMVREAIGDSFRRKYSIELPELDNRDIQLTLKWCADERRQKPLIRFISREQLVREHGDNYDLARMLSARAAEKAVVQFMRDMHFGEIKDVSITQLDDSIASDMWKQYDILADGIPYDVKNSRRTRLNPSNYVEHCVPHYKEIRGREVKVAGTLSHYLWAKELLDHSSLSLIRQTSIRVLGFTDKSTVTKLNAYFEKESFRLEFRRPNRGEYFLPAWVFDYPESFYSQRNDALGQITRMVGLEDWLQSQYNPIPVYLALGIDPPSEWYSRMQYTWQKDFVQRVLHSCNEFGLSLPALFLTILTHFLDMVTSQEQLTESYSPSEYYSMLFATRVDSSPLFLHDPLRTVEGLIETLLVLWNSRSNRIKDYSSFRLVSMGILRGSLVKNPSVEHSLVAYCGGRTEDNHPCGNVPLVLGTHQHCERCGMLICDKCGFCSIQCPRNNERQSRFKGQRRSDIRDKAVLDIEDDTLY